MTDPSSASSTSSLGKTGNGDPDQDKSQREMGSPQEKPEAERSDAQTSVDELKAVVQQFVDERHWQEFHNPKNLVMSLAIETAELMEHFQWLTADQSLGIMDDPKTAHEVGEEVADCLAYLLAIASKLEIDLATTLRAKMIQNAVKYPIPD